MPATLLGLETNVMQSEKNALRPLYVNEGQKEHH